MHKKRKIQKKRSTNIKFIYGLTILGALLIALSLFERENPTHASANTSSSGMTSKTKSFQPTDTKKDSPGKLLWGRDF